MCLIDQKYIITLTAISKETFQIHMGIKEVIVVSDDAVSEQAQIQSEFKRAYPIFQGIFFYFASGKALFPGQQIINCIIDPVKMSFGIRALLRITFGTFLKTDLLFRCQNNTFESQSLLPQQRKSVLRHRPGDGLGGEIEQLVSHILSHGLYRGKDRGYGLTDSRRSFNK